MNRRTFLATVSAAVLGKDHLRVAPRRPRTGQIEIRYTANDVEYIEKREFLAHEIARIYGIPPKYLAVYRSSVYNVVSDPLLPRR